MSFDCCGLVIVLHHCVVHSVIQSGIMYKNDNRGSSRIHEHESRIGSQLLQPRRVPPPSSSVTFSPLVELRRISAMMAKTVGPVAKSGGTHVPSGLQEDPTLVAMFSEVYRDVETGVASLVRSAGASDSNEGELRAQFKEALDATTRQTQLLTDVSDSVLDVMRGQVNALGTSLAYPLLSERVESAFKNEEARRKKAEAEAHRKVQFDDGERRRRVEDDEDVGEGAQ